MHAGARALIDEPIERAVSVLKNAAPNSHQFYRNLYEENKKKRTGSSKKAQVHASC